MQAKLKKEGNKEEESSSLYGDIFYNNFMWLWEQWDPEMDPKKLSEASGISVGYLNHLLSPKHHRFFGQKTLKTLIKVFQCSRLDFIKFDDISHIMQGKYFREMKKLREILESDQPELVEVLLGSINNLYNILEKSKTHKKKQMG